MNQENSFSPSPSPENQDPTSASLFATSREYLVLLRIEQLSADATDTSLPVTARSPAYQELGRLWNEERPLLKTALADPTHPAHANTKETLTEVLKDHLEIIAANPSGRSQSLTLVTNVATMAPSLLAAVQAACTAPQEPEHRQWMIDTLSMSDPHAALRTVQDQLHCKAYPPDATRRELQRHLWLQDLYDRASILEQVQHHSSQTYSDRFALELGNALQFPPGNNTLLFLKDLLKPEHSESTVFQQAAKELITRLTDTHMPTSAVETILQHPALTSYLSKTPIAELSITNANTPAIHTAAAISRNQLRTLPPGDDAIHGSLKLLQLLLQVPPGTNPAFSAKLLTSLRDTDERDHTVGTQRQFWPHLIHSLLSSEIHRPTALYAAAAELGRADSPWLSSVVPLLIEQLLEDSSRVTTLVGQIGGSLGMERLVASLHDSARTQNQSAEVLLYKWRLMDQENTLNSVFTIPPAPSVFRAFRTAICGESSPS